MTNNTAVELHYFAAAEQALAATQRVTPGTAQALFNEIKRTPSQGFGRFESRVLIAATRTVEITGTSYHPKALTSWVMDAMQAVA